MGYTIQNDEAIGNGGAGTPGAWDIISAANPLTEASGLIAVAFMNILEDAGTFSAMKEQTTIPKKGKESEAVSEDVDAKYLAYSYPQNVVFEGRYTALTPVGTSQFKVWFLK